MTIPAGEVTLLPCPFCGGEAHPGTVSYHRPLNDVEWEDGSPITIAHFVSCASCGASSRTTIAGGHQTRTKAVAAWNTRPAAPVPDETAGALVSPRLRALVDADRDHMVATTPDDLEWLIEQLIMWPERIHPGRTTNSRFLRYSMAATLLAHLSQGSRP